MASSPCISVRSAMGTSASSALDEIQPPYSFRTHKHPQRLLQSASRSGYGAQVASFAIATTTVVGLSFFSVDLSAMAAELNGGKPAINSIHSNPSSSRNPNHDANSDLSFSMAIPIPHDQAWFSVESGFIAPLPHFKGDGLVIPPPQARKPTASLKASIFRCPQWTPSELEMVLPDFHGRPKPFRHQWSASVAVRLMPADKSLPQLSALDDDMACDGTVTIDEAYMSADMAPSGEEMLALLKLLGMEKFMCFSM